MIGDAGKLSDGEIAKLAIDQAQQAGCECEPITLQIFHVAGDALIQANMSHTDECPFKEARRERAIALAVALEGEANELRRLLSQAVEMLTSKHAYDPWPLVSRCTEMGVEP